LSLIKAIIYSKMKKLEEPEITDPRIIEALERNARIDPLSVCPHQLAVAFLSEASMILGSVISGSSNTYFKFNRAIL
jgi:hypothetical protein